jgi:hypothetical protein
MYPPGLIAGYDDFSVLGGSNGQDRRIQGHHG